MNEWQELVAKTIVDTRKEAIDQALTNLWVFVAIMVLFFMQGNGWVFGLLMIVGTVVNYLLKKFVAKKIDQALKKRV